MRQVPKMSQQNTWPVPPPRFTPMVVTCTLVTHHRPQVQLLPQAGQPCTDARKYSRVLPDHRTLGGKRLCAEGAEWPPGCHRRAGRGVSEVKPEGHRVRFCSACLGRARPHPSSSTSHCRRVELGHFKAPTRLSATAQILGPFQWEERDLRDGFSSLVEK